MKLATLTIENFRAIKKATINFNDYTCIVGPNGVGKSTILAALNVLFRQPTGKGAQADALVREDFHGKDTSNPVKITGSFKDLSPEAQEDLKHYYRQGKLTFSAVAKWDESQQRAPIQQFGSRKVMLDFARWFAKAGGGAKAPELKLIYSELKEKFSLPGATSKGDMEQALRDYEEAHPELTEENESNDTFYGAAGSSGLLSKYVQWVHVPAVKDAADEQAEAKNTWLGQLLQRAVRGNVNFEAALNDVQVEAAEKVRKILEDQQGTLAALSESLTSRISKWVHPDAKILLRWDNDPTNGVSIKQPFARVDADDGVFEGSLLRQGHGFQRTYLLSLLQEMANAPGGDACTLLLGVEEPELYQHPPQARHLAAVLEGLSSRDQVIVCTHSPYFISGKGFQDVRMIRRVDRSAASEVFAATLEDVRKRLEAARPNSGATLEGTRIKLHQRLQPHANEMFFAPVVLLVEGSEDAAYINSYLHLAGHDEEFRRLGCHVVWTDGKSHLWGLLAVATSMKIPTFVMFDCDGNLCVAKEGATSEQKHKADSARGQHSQDNLALFRLAGHEDVPAFPELEVWEENLVAWPTNLTQIVQQEIGNEVLATARKTVREKYGVSDSDINKSALFIGAVMHQLWEEGQKSASLLGVIDAVLKFARKQRQTPSNPTEEAMVA